jgi:hypothetical protein
MTDAPETKPYWRRRHPTPGSRKWNKNQFNSMTVEQQALYLDSVARKFNLGTTPGDQPQVTTTND